MFKPLLTSLHAGRARLTAVLPPLEMPVLVDVRGVPRPLKVRSHANARRIVLRFDPRTGHGKITIPPGTASSAVLTFLSQSRGWIDAHAPVLPSMTDVPYPSTIPLAGEDHAILPTGNLRGTVTLDDQHQLHVPGAPHRIMPRLAQFLKTEAERSLTPQVLALCARLGKQPSAIRYRDPRSQWGSCSSARVITLSWRVMMAPPNAQAYLVAHEVAHLAQMNHSQRFWKVVAGLEPDWRAGQKALKAGEKKLMAIRFTS